MDIESLKYFLAIDKFSNFSSAAEELCISQSSLSKHIKKLESELECTLFIRGTRQTELTPAGIILKEYAINSINEYNSLLSNLNRFSSNNPVLSIGYIPIITQYNIANHIGHFCNLYENVKMNFEEGEHNQILELLLSHKINFAILRNEGLDPLAFDITPLADDELAIIVPKTHPFSKKKYVSIKDLSQEKIISLGKNSGIYSLFMNECNKYSFNPNIICFNSRIENILGLVSAGMGISPLMKKSVECFNKCDIRIILLKEKINNQLCIVHLKNKKLNTTEKNFKSQLIADCNYKNR